MFEVEFVQITCENYLESPVHEMVYESINSQGNL